MRIISTKISYDNLISKLPGVTPSLVNSWTLPPLYNCGNETNGEKYYNYSSAVKRAYEYNINSAELICGADFVTFDKNNIIEFCSGNYGLIPSDVIIPKNIADTITDYTDIYVNIPDGNGGFYDLSWPKNSSDPHYEGRKIISGGTEIKVLTNYTLNKWYSFFKKYYELVDHPAHPRIYKSATDYFNKEIKVKNEENADFYKSLDDIFVSRGGRAMYDWISNNCIIQYNIPREFVDEWHTTYLYFPDAIKWYQWFKDRYELYKYVAYVEDCKDVKDCCDCTEYLRLGGNDFYAGKDRKSGLREWVENFELDNSFATMSASITIPVDILSSIDDLGEMAMLSSEWQEEVDYHNTSGEKGYEKPSPSGGGTTINKPHVKHGKCRNCEYESGINEFEGKHINELKCPKCGSVNIDEFDVVYDEPYMIKNGEQNKGYLYNEYYENVFNEDDWITYTDYYISENPSLFSSNGVKNGTLVELTGYTVSPINGKIIYNPIDSDVSKKYNIKRIDCTCINGVTYEVIDGKYVELCYDTNTIASLKYKKHEKLRIYKDGELEYTILNGKRRYVELDRNNEERVYFLRESNCYDEGCKVQVGRYISFDGCLYLVYNKLINIYDDEATRVYPILDGYFDVDGNRFYISGETVVIQDGYEYDDTNSIYTYKFRGLNEDEMRVMKFKRFKIGADYIIVYYTYDTTNCRIVSGHTDSKLDLLRRKEISTDDLGNELPGYFRSIVDIDKGEGQSIYNVPYDECMLDILFKVGEASGLYPNDSLSDDINEYYDGNIITDIEFYYADKLRNKKIIVKANNDDALSAIASCEQQYENSNDDTIINVLFCDITYHMGAVIKKVGTDYYLADEFHTGVKYIDTVYVKKQTGTYYLNNDRSFTFSYYFLTQDVESINATDFNALMTWDISTYFELFPRLYVENGGNVEELGGDTFYAGWSNNNGTTVSPLFRNEFNIGSSHPQNVDADIYIDRGISAAFEKHLKLQEVRTMEALEKLGNSSSVSGFKINKY